jgi:hypothetical protein
MAEYEIVENSSEDDYPSSPMPPRQSVREALSSIDAIRSGLQAQRAFGFDDANLGFDSEENQTIQTYGERDDRAQQLESVLNEDLYYSAYFNKRFGNLDVYFNLDNIQYPEGFNPLTDKYVNVKIAKEGKLYISDHVNPNQIIEELLDGVVSFLVIKVNGQITKIVGTLKSELVRGESHVREAAFNLLPDGRVLVWNVRKSKWSSFYPDNLLEMTRDDTTEFE